MSDSQTSLLAPAVSPLAEADPNAINDLISSERMNEIVNKPPLDLTDPDIKVLIAYYQRERLRFKTESELKEQRPRATGRRKTPTSVADAIASSMDLL